MAKRGALVLTWIEDHPGTAAWMQAIGAILALVLAVGFPIWQRWDSERAALRLLARAIGLALLRLQGAAVALIEGSVQALAINGEALQSEAGRLDRAELWRLSAEDGSDVQDITIRLHSLAKLLATSDLLTNGLAKEVFAGSSRLLLTDVKRLRERRPKMMENLFPLEAELQTTLGRLDVAERLGRSA